MTAGMLTVKGPAPLQQDRTCVSGQVCSFDDMLGQHLSETDKIVVLETCGTDMLEARFPSAGFLADVVASGATMSWGSTRISAAGGQYRLCWCDGSSSLCSLSRDFATDFGGLTVIGVSPLRQVRTCVSGQACSVHGITGQHLAAGDSWMALDTCGQQTSIPRFAYAGSSYEVSASGSAITWGFVSPTAAGGQYRLCWCSSGFDCISGEDFVVDAGSLILLGISPLFQDRTCSSGSPCFLYGLQGLWHDTEIAQESSLIALDTCGLASAIPRFSSSGMLAQDAQAGGGGSVAFSARVAATTAGGTYRLCWCFGENLCDVPEQHQVDIGALFVLGPSPLSQSWTCISGQTCRLHGVSGAGLQAADAFAVLRTCGTDHVPDRFPAAGILSTDSSPSGEILLYFGAHAITGSAADYRVCWCSPLEAASCSTGSFFATDFGTLTLLGPGPLHQDRTCVSGQTCRMSGIIGAGMMDGDAFVVQDTCGLSETVRGFPLRGHPVLSHSSGAAVDWGEHRITAAGGLYRLCWCSELSGMGCSSAREFNVDVGSLTLQGVAPLAQSKTCISGVTCEITGLVGTHLSPLDQYLILETCGVEAGPALPYTLPLEGFETGSAKASNGRWVSSPLQLAGGDYRLCWCSGQHFACSTQVSFRIDVGMFSVIGVAPLSQHRTCISGHMCFVQEILGSGLSSDDVLFAAETCGQDNSLARFPFAGKSSMQTTVAGTTFSQLERITSAGGVFRLCWCHTSATEDSARNCLAARDAIMDIGSLVLVGVAPLSQDRTCVSGSTCSIAGITGQELGIEDRLFVMDTCGSAKWLVNGFPSSGSSAISNEGTSFDFGFAIVSAAGGTYQLCWCSGAGSIDSGECNIGEDAQVTVGQLTLIGTSPLSQDRTCVAGQTCSIEGLVGQNLPETGSMLMVMETCGVASSPEGFALADPWAVMNSLGGVQDFQSSEPLTTAGGIYRLCWCSGLESCTSASNFRIDTGALMILGPFPLRQGVTCVQASGPFLLMQRRVHT